MPEQDEEDVTRYGDNYAPGVVAPPSNIVQEQAAPVTLPGSSDAVIGTAVGQLNAGQPVTALPRQSWSFPEQQAFNARLDAFDQQAKAARIARDQAARDAQMLDQMMRVARSTKDIEVAMQQHDQMGFQAHVANGGNPLLGLSLFPRAATPGLVAAARALQPITAPHIVTDQGEKAWVSGAGHITRIPSPEPNMANPELVTLPDGTTVAHVSPQKWQVVAKAPAAGSLNDVQRADLRAIDQEAHEKRVALDKLRPTSQEYLDTQMALGELAIRRKKVLAGTAGTKAAPQSAPAPAVAAPSPAPATNAPIRSAVRNPKTGKWELK